MSKRTETLKSQAGQLAKTQKEEKPSQGIEILVFKLEQEKYAIETKFVEEVTFLKNYTPLPCVPSFIFGLVNVRRKILSIFNLKAFFSLNEQNKPRRLVIVKEKEMELALLADEVYDIQYIPLTQIHAPPPLSNNDMKEVFLEGIAPDNIIIINGSKLLSSKQIIVDDVVEI